MRTCTRFLAIFFTGAVVGALGQTCPPDTLVAPSFRAEACGGTNFGAYAGPWTKVADDTNASAFRNLLVWQNPVTGREVLVGSVEVDSTWRQLPSTLASVWLYEPDGATGALVRVEFPFDSMWSVRGLETSANWIFAGCTSDDIFTGTTADARLFGYTGADWQALTPSSWQGYAPFQISALRMYNGDLYMSVAVGVPVGQPAEVTLWRCRGVDAKTAAEIRTSWELVKVFPYMARIAMLEVMTDPATGLRYLMVGTDTQLPELADVTVSATEFYARLDSLNRFAGGVGARAVPPAYATFVQSAGQVVWRAAELYTYQEATDSLSLAVDLFGLAPETTNPQLLALLGEWGIRGGLDLGGGRFLFGTHPGGRVVQVDFPDGMHAQARRLANTSYNPTNPLTEPDINAVTSKGFFFPGDFVRYNNLVLIPWGFFRMSLMAYNPAYPGCTQCEDLVDHSLLEKHFAATAAALYGTKLYVGVRRQSGAFGSRGGAELWVRELPVQGPITASEVPGSTKSPALTVYPNPVATLLTVAWPGAAPSERCTYRLMSPHGVVLLEGALTTPTDALDVSAVPTGYYLLAVTTGGHTHYRTVVVAR